jgi:hypothetical protein
MLILVWSLIMKLPLSSQLYKEAVAAYTSALEALALDSNPDTCDAQKQLVLTNRATVSLPACPLMFSLMHAYV